MAVVASCVQRTLRSLAYVVRQREGGVSSAEEEIRVARLSGGPVRYRDHGEGRPLVFLHGLLVNSRLWRAVAPGLAGDARVIVPDLPLGGHELPMNPSADLAPPCVADLVVELLDHLGIDSAVLVGSDTGGAIAQILTARHPGRVTTLVLAPCDAYDNFLPPVLRYAQVAARIPGGVRLATQALRVGWIRRLPIALGWLARRPIPADVLEGYLGPARRSPAIRRDLGKVLRGISRRQTLAAAEALVTFPRPQVMVWADTPRVFPLAHGRRLAEQAPDGRLVVVPDSYALVPEDDPEVLLGALRDLLVELAERPAAR